MMTREWATPLTIGSFVLMAVTGVLMFFHQDMGLNKLAHEWLGWVMVAAVVAHALANWLAFRRYLLMSRVGQGIIAVSVLVTAASFFTLLGGADKPIPPHVMALKAVTRAPVASIAPLTGRGVEQVIADLAAVGLVVPDAQTSLDKVIAGNKEMQGKAIRVLFGQR